MSSPSREPVFAFTPRRGPLPRWQVRLGWFAIVVTLLVWLTPFIGASWQNHQADQQRGADVAPAIGHSSPACDFLSDSLATFLPPNPGPTSAAESVEYDEIRAEMRVEGC